jgi:addiction module HigA family antidote
MTPTHRPPTRPGELLRNEFLAPLGLTQVALAAKMGISAARVRTLLRGRRGVTAETALLLAAALGTTPEFWMNLQTAHDLWHARRALRSAG